MTSFRMTRRVAVCTCLSFVVLLGCNSSGTTPVEGQVLLDGNPLPNVSIQFVPQGTGQDATGATDAEGKFAMSTNEPSDGVMPGSYKVVITPRLTTPPQQFASADEAMRAAAVAKPVALNSEFPQKYTRVDQTPLTIDVPLKERKTVFELKSN
jgi:hypothetical protein